MQEVEEKTEKLAQEEAKQSSSVQKYMSGAAAGAAAGRGGRNILNSVLLSVFEGKTHATSEMMGHRQNLAESVQAKMSQAFGMDVSQIKFYRSDAMSGTDMKGISQGNTVVLSSDVDLNTAEGQAVLGHELSHIHAQSQGIGMGHGGLYHNAALEHQADVEGMRAAHGRPIYQDNMVFSDGMKYSLGMKGVEGLAPMSSGLGATAAAPMQAKKDDKGSEQHEQQNAEHPAEVPKADEPNDGIAPDLKEVAPLAWRRPTSNGSAEKGPELGIHIKQPKGSEGGNLGKGEMGMHTFMSLEYNKHSRLRGKNQRFRTSFGFYPQGKTDMIGVFAQGGTTAGQLYDDYNHDADVSRSYPINFAQLNTIAREASTYANSGYNLYSRNCTTFVADMAAKANVDTGSIFQKDEEWTLGAGNRIKFGALKSFGALFSTDSYTDDLNKKVGKKDLRYGVNRNLVYAQDVKTYTQSRKRGGVEAKGYSPITTGARMRTSAIGGLGGAISGVSNPVKNWIRQFTEENVRTLWQSTAANQATRSGPDWEEEAMTAMEPLFRKVGEMQQSYQLLTAAGAEGTDRKQQKANYGRYTAASTEVYDMLHDWFRRYGQKYTILAEFVEGFYGKIRVMDQELMNLFPDGFAGVDSDSVIDRAFADVAGNNGELISDYAEKLAFGNTDEGREKASRYTELAQKGELSEREKSEFRKLSIVKQNGDYYKRLTLDLLDERMERYESNGIKQDDLNEVFLDIPEQSVPAEERENGTSAFSMNIQDGKFLNFAGAMQTATLRVLFGEEGEQLVANQMKEGGALAGWKERDDINPRSDGPLGEVLNGIHSVTKSVLDGKPKEVRMLMNSLAKTPECADFSPFELAMKTVNVIESFYVNPLLSEAIKGQQNYKGKFTSVLKAQKGQQGETSHMNESQYYAALNENEDMERSKGKTSRQKAIPQRSLVEELKTMAQEIKAEQAKNK